jgi:hypothetical protein
MDDAPRRSAFLGHSALTQLRVVTDRSLPDIAIYACYRKVRVGRGDSSIPVVLSRQLGRSYLRCEVERSLRSQNRR